MLIANELKKIKTFDLGKKYFGEDGAQNYLVFQSMLEYFALNSKWITKWKSKVLSNESVEVFSKTDNILTPSINKI